MSNKQEATLDLEQLLRSAAGALRAGNRPAARALFLALSREHPDEPRIWLGLAEASSDQYEQARALARALAIDPTNDEARAALARLEGEPSDPGATAVLPETVAARSEAEPDALPAAGRLAPVAREPEQTASPFPLLNLLALIVILLLLGAVGVVIGRNLFGGGQIGTSPTATPVLAALPDGAQPTLALPTVPPTVAVADPGATSAVPAATGASQLPPQAVSPPAATVAGDGTAAPDAATAPAGPAAPPSPVPTLTTELPLGQIVDYDGWSATLLQPEYAIPLDGAIGDLQPAGRFVLAVVAVSNNSPNPRQIPADLFTLTDGTGRSFGPLPGASSAYLALYERGQRGDLALEDVLDPASGMRSVPIIFDVPLDATGLRLTMVGAAGAGWPIGGGAPAPAGP